MINIPPLDSTADYQPLQHYLCEANSLQPNTTLVLSPNVTHTIALGEFCLVSGASQLTLMGSQAEDYGMAKVLCTNETQGIGFYNVTGLSLHDIVFSNCGGIFSNNVSVNNSMFIFDATQKTTLLLDHCSDVTLCNIHISSYNGFAVVAINLHGGHMEEVSVDNSQSLYGCQPIIDNNCTAGSGVILYYTETATRQSIQEVTLAIIRSSFTGNKNYVPSAFDQDALKRQLWQHDSFPIVGASSVTIVLTQTQYTVNISLQECTFTQNNADTGSFGAVLALFLCPLDKGNLQIISSIFSQNNYQYVPGQREGHDVNVYVKPLDSSGHADKPQLTISMTNFTSSLKERSPTTCINVIAFPNGEDSGTHFIFLVDSVIFQSATGHVYVSSFPPTTSAKYMDTVLRDITAIEGLSRGQPGHPSPYGVLEFHSVGLVMAEGTSLQTNYYTGSRGHAFYILNCDLHLSGYIHIDESDGGNGAAILLEASAHLVFHEPLKALLTRNHAVHGSAVYSIQSGDTLCVFQYVTHENSVYTIENITDMNITVDLVGNVANIAGHSIFAYPLYFCELYPDTRVKIDTLSNSSATSLIYESIFNSSEPLNSEISSLPTNICNCNITTGDVLNCGHFEAYSYDAGVIYPGRTFSVGIMTIDNNRQPVSSQLVSQVISGGQRDIETWTLAEDQRSIQLPGGGCSQVNYTVYTTNPVDVTTLNYVALISNSYSSVGAASIFYIDMQVCPPGFQEVGNGFCDCIPLLANKKLKCDIDDVTIERPTNSWIGLTVPDAERNTSQFAPRQFTSDVEVGFAPFCPSSYCKPNAATVDLSENPDDLCMGSRSGLVCGACKGNKSVVFGSEECFNCSNLWILVLPLFAIAGILLVILLFCLRLTVSYGTVNGLIFYANVVGVHIDFLLSHSALQFLQIFISFVNLDLGFPLCFYNGMDELVKTGLSFVFPVYLWTIVIVIIVTSRYSTRVAKLTAHASVPVLATLIHLSFSTLLSTVLTVFAYTTVESGRAESIHVETRAVWFYDGNVAYGDGWHLLLLLLSVLATLLFLIPYTVVLTGVSYFLKFRIVNYFKPIIDSYHGPYKDKWRFWFGARLWLVLSVYLINAVLGGLSVSLTFFLHTFLVIGFTFVQIHIKPFRNKLVNLLDLSFLINYMIIALSGAYFHAASSDPDILNGIAGTFVLVAFITFWGIVIHHLLKVLGIYDRIRVQKYVCNTAKSVSKAAHDQHSSRGHSPSTHDLAVSGSQLENGERSSELRESLLEYVHVQH